MAIRGIDTNLTIGKVAEQSTEATRAAQYHESLLEKLAARAHQQEAQNAERTQAAAAAEKRGVNDLNVDSQGGGQGGGGGKGRKPEEEAEARENQELTLSAGPAPSYKLDITI